MNSWNPCAGLARGPRRANTSKRLPRQTSLTYISKFRTNLAKLRWVKRKSLQSLAYAELTPSLRGLPPLQDWWYKPHQGQHPKARGRSYAELTPELTRSLRGQASYAGLVFEGFGSLDCFAGWFWICYWFSDSFIVFQYVGRCRSIGGLSIGDPIPYIYIYIYICIYLKWLHFFRFYELNCIFKQKSLRRRLTRSLRDSTLQVISGDFQKLQNSEFASAVSYADLTQPWYELTRKKITESPIPLSIVKC